MCSSPEPIAIVLALAVAACGTDAVPGEPPPALVCDETSVLTYQNFGEPFLLDWCRGCHASGLPEDMRQGAPLGADFDDLDRVRARAPAIVARTAGAMPTMPPGAGPSAQERELLVEWIACGLP
jgi:uncharacterized membrane protein